MTIYDVLQVTASRQPHPDKSLHSQNGFFLILSELLVLNPAQASSNECLNLNSHFFISTPNIFILDFEYKISFILYREPLWILELVLVHLRADPVVSLGPFLKLNIPLFLSKFLSQSFQLSLLFLYL